MPRDLGRRLVEALELGTGLASVVALGVAFTPAPPDDDDRRLGRLLAEHAATCVFCRLPEHSDGRGPSRLGPRPDAAPTRESRGKIAARAQDPSPIHEDHDVHATHPAGPARRDPRPIP
jgi:hypothetical protein